MKKLTVFSGIILCLFLCYDFTLSQQPLIKPIFAKITDLADVNVPSHTDGYALSWDSTTGKYIEAAAIPSGSVDVSGTPVDNDYAKWTDANTIEGRSYSETLSDLSGEATATFDLNTQLLDDALGYCYDTIPTATPSSAFTVDWTTSHVHQITITGTTLDITCTDPPSPCFLLLIIIQGDGDDTIDWTNEADIKFPGNVDPTLSTGSGDLDIVRMFWTGTLYVALFNGNFE